MRQDDADAEQQRCISQRSKTRSVALGINWLFQALVLTQGSKRKPKPLMQGGMCPVTATPAEPQEDRDQLKEGGSRLSEISTTHHRRKMVPDQEASAHVIAQATPNLPPAKGKILLWIYC